MCFLRASLLVCVYVSARKKDEEDDEDKKQLGGLPSQKLDEAEKKKRKIKIFCIKSWLN
jgi:hypothetical protein